MVGSSANSNERNFVECLGEFEALRNLLELGLEVNQTDADLFARLRDVFYFAIVY